MCVCTRTCMHAYMFVCVRVCMHMCACVCVCMHVCVCMCPQACAHAVLFHAWITLTAKFSANIPFNIKKLVKLCFSVQFLGDLGHTTLFVYICF